MADTKAARQAINVTGPRASQLGVPGSVVVIAVTTGTSYINLSSLFPPALTYTPATPVGGGSGTVASNSPYSQQTNGVCDQYISVYADTANVGIITGLAVGDVTSSNAPSLTAAGSATGGVYTSALGSCWVIPAGTCLRFRPLLSQDVYLGFVGSTSGYIRIYQSSGAGS